MLNQLSNQMADAVAAAAPSVVQVNGGRRPVSGLVYAADVILTTMRGVGHHEHVPVRRHDGQVLQGDLGGFDPSTQLAVLRVPGLALAPIVRAESEPRVGHLALAIARSWSNAVTATAGWATPSGTATSPRPWSPCSSEPRPTGSSPVPSQSPLPQASRRS